jgi:hypothetical protein
MSECDSGEISGWIMTFENLGGEGLDYLPCRYGKSKLLFRGPRKKLDTPYVAMLGGTETYGKFIETPVSELLQALSGQTVVNFGHLNAGIDAFLNDPTVMELCSGAELTIVQVMGAQNMSNRLYTVHPRRNDRFLKASKFLQTLYRNTDFTQFHYTRHLLSALHDESAERYALVREELQSAWLARMHTLLDRITGETWLLWLSDRAIADGAMDDPLARDPLFVDRAMLDELASRVTMIVEVAGSRDEIAAGQDRMVFSPLEEPVAQEILGPVVHESAAKALNHAVVELL